MIFSQKEIYERAKEMFVERGFDVEFGSNIQQIQNSMQYLVSMLNQNTQINVRETILSSQTKRNMILEGARLFGYEQTPKRSYEYTLDFKARNNSNQNINLQFGNLTEVNSNGNSYFYFGDVKDITIPRNPNVDFNFSIGGFREGVIHSHLTTPSLNYTIQMTLGETGWTPQEFIDIPFQNVQENGITIETEDLDGTISTWSQQEQLFLDRNTIIVNEFIRQDDIETGMPRIYFKYGNWGKTLDIGTRVRVTVFVSKGNGGISDGTFTHNFEFNDLDLEIIGSQVSINGSDEESSSSIKTNQALFDNAQGRIVTKHDYLQLQSKQAGVEYAQIWDGLDEISKLAGNIWFSFLNNQQKFELSDTSQGDNIIPNVPNRTWVLENTQGEEYYMIDSVIIDGVEYGWWDDDGSNIVEAGIDNVSKIFREIKKYTIPTMRFNFRQPIFLDFDIEVKVQRYNQQKSIIEQNESISKQVVEFFNGENNINKFDQSFFSSSLIDYIVDNTTDDIMFDINVKNSLLINKKHVVKGPQDYEVPDRDKIVIRLGQEYVKLQDGELIISNLPNIRTVDFYEGKTLKMPTATSEFVYNKGVFVQKLYLEGVSSSIGEYRVFQNMSAIEIVLNSEDFEDALETDILRMEVSYPTPNISVKKNTQIRLHSIEVSKS